MERLTKRIDENHLCIEVCEKACVEGNTFCPKCKPFTAVLKKLMEYEDLEEQGLLLKLPCPLRCKVGDIIWYVEDDDDDYPMEMKVEKVSVFADRIHYHAIAKCGGTCIFIEKEFGKTVFLTKEEAEKALAEMEK